jgi:hypothetical protein
VRLPDDSIAIAIVSQMEMAAPGNVSDDQDVSLRLLCRSMGASQRAGEQDSGAERSANAA